MRNVSALVVAALGIAALLDIVVSLGATSVRWALVAAALAVGAALAHRMVTRWSPSSVDPRENGGSSDRDAAQPGESAAMQAYASALARSLRALFGRSCAFVLLATPVGQAPAKVQYVSNLARQDGTDLVRRLLASWQVPAPTAAEAAAPLERGRGNGQIEPAAAKALANALAQPTFFGALWHVLEYAHDAVILWQMDGAGILYWNQAAESLYGYDREEVRGRVTHTLLRTVPSGAVVSELEDKLARYGMWVGELQHTARDGKRILVQSRLSLVAQVDGKWLVLELNRDVTDRVNAEQSRRDTERQLSVLSRRLRAV